MICGQNQKTMSAHNRTSVLSLIHRSKQGISRTEIADTLALTRPALTKIAAQLIGTGVVRQRMVNGLRRSDPKALMTLNPHWGYAACIALTHNLAIGILNLRGELVYHERLAGDGVSRGSYRDQFDELLPQAVRRLLTECRDRPLLGIGVLSSGYVDRQGIIRFNGDLPRRNVDLRAMLAPLTDLPVFVDEDMRLLLRSRVWAGMSPEEYLVAVSPGVYGYGGPETLVVRGEPYAGCDGCAGQFRWTVKVPHEEAAVHRMMEQVAAWGGAEAYLDRVLRRDPEAMDIYRRVVENYGWRLAHIANTYNPNTILVYSPYAPLGADFVEAVSGVMKQQAHPVVCERLHVELGGDRTDRERLIAAGIPVLSRVFEDGLLVSPRRVRVR